MTLQRWMERIAEKEVERITAKCRRYQEQGKPVPAWVRAGMDERFSPCGAGGATGADAAGIFASHGVLPLEFKPAYSVGDLLLQHLDALEQEAEEKGGAAGGLIAPAPRGRERRVSSSWATAAWPVGVRSKRAVEVDLGAELGQDGGGDGAAPAGARERVCRREGPRRGPGGAGTETKSTHST